MAIHHTRIAWTLPLPPVPKLVVLAIADSASQKGMLMSLDGIAVKTGVHQTIIDNVVAHMVKGGVLVSHGQYWQLCLDE